MQLPKEELIHDITFYKYPRVDSFDLYRNGVADAILSKIYPKAGTLKKLEIEEFF